MIDLHVQSAAFSELNYLTETTENIHEKPWLRTALCSHLIRLMSLKKPPIKITQDEAYILFDNWLDWRWSNGLDEKKEQLK